MTVRTSGCPASHAMTARFQRAQLERSGSTRFRVASESGQPWWPTWSPYHRFARATASRAGTQCPAWLSPIRTTVAIARALGAPKEQTRLPASRNASGQPGPRRLASSGVGTTVLPQRASRHRLAASRAAAPKQFRLPAITCSVCRSAVWSRAST